MQQANAESCFFRQLKESSLHPQIIRQARKSGQLNLSNRGLAEMPDIVWNLNSLSREESQSLSVSLDTSGQEDRWWDFVDLTKMILASNALQHISPEIANYKALTVLDLHDNALTSLPETVAELKELRKLNLSRNCFEALPSCVFQLPALRTLLAQHNRLRQVNDGLGNLSFLEELDLSFNQIEKIPHCIGFLSHVTDLNLSNNELVVLPVEIGDMSAVKRLDMSKNKLRQLPGLIETLHRLEQLYVQHNVLVALPPLPHCTVIKEIHAGFNSIEALAVEFVESVPNIKILDLRDNKIPAVPDNICLLQALERLDLSNNSLSTLPYSLGTLPHLKFLSIDGNPMRSIRRDIIQRGTVQLLRWLRDRMEDVPAAASRTGTGAIASPIPDTFTLRSSKALTLSNRKLTTVPKEAIEKAVEADVRTLDLSQNVLTDLAPQELAMLLPRLVELNVAQNRLSCVPPCLGLGRNLQYLDFRNNRLSSLPEEISNLDQLREINISFNKFGSLPSCLYGLGRLEIVLASGNQIEEIVVAEGLATLPCLATLDLRNNSIRAVPPQLGHLTQLRSLQLEGNLFRHPRPALLAQGTVPLLAFLRDRLSTDS